MIHFTKFIELIDKPVCIVGKGKSSEKFLADPTIANNYFTIGLNHVAQLVPVNASHIIDYEVLNEQIVENSAHLIMPWHLHYNFKPTKQPLPDLIYWPWKSKTVWYDLSTWKGKHKSKPLVVARYFSGEAIFHLLALLDFKVIYSFGVDGGTEYAKQFYDLGLEPLTNGRTSFDASLSIITNTCNKFKIKWIKL